MYTQPPVDSNSNQKSYTYHFISIQLFIVKSLGLFSLLKHHHNHKKNNHTQIFDRMDKSIFLIRPGVCRLESDSVKITSTVRFLISSLPLSVYFWTAKNEFHYFHGKRSIKLNCFGWFFGTGEFSWILIKTKTCTFLDYFGRV